MVRALQRTVVRLGLLSASVLICLGLIEIGLRAFWGGYYLKEPKGYAQVHASLGWVNRPSIHIDYGDPEFRTTVVHNSWGLRGPEIPREKPEEGCRVLVLGDSFTWGVGVENDETFSARLEQMEPHLQVLNAGVNGYGTAQELLFLVETGLGFSPDLVIVSFFWNDVANSYSREFPAFRLQDDELRYPPPPPAESTVSPASPSPRRKYLKRSYAYRFISDRMKLLRYYVRAALGIPVEDSELLRPEDLQPAWKLELALLSEIARVARSRGAATLVLLIPEQTQVQPEVKVIGLRPVDYEIQQRLLTWGEETGIPVLDPLPDLRAAYEREGAPLYYRRDRHLRENGHRIIAHRLLEEIRGRQLVSCLARASTRSEN